jgi:hypothetical protein
VTLSAIQIQNLLYLVGALGVATVISALYVLRHRKPKSLEAGIESFSRELRALAPERRMAPVRDRRSGGDREPAEDRGGVRPHPIVQTVASRTAAPTQVDPGPEAAAAPGPDHDRTAEQPARGEGG